MQWVSELSSTASFVDALAEAAAGVHARLDGSQPDIVFAFVSPHHAEHWGRIPEVVSEAFGGAPVFGCSGGGVIGGGREIERTPALALVGAVLPGVEVRSFALAPGEIPAIDSAAESWHGRAEIDPADLGALLLVADPFTCDVPPMLAGLDRAFPDAVKIGGLASGGSQPGQTALFCGGQTHDDGMIGLSLGGNLVVDTLVAQGCRPVGTPMFVTRTDGHVILELDGRPAARVLQELYESSNERDRELMRKALFVGLVTEPGREVYGAGDFLVRNILGLDARTGALAVAAKVRQNGVVQFHVRDADASAHDLRSLLRGYTARGNRPAGALMFSCLGRGVGLYGVPNHDVDELREQLGEVPAGGFFCNGEIGPVGGHTYMHGYTSSIALFRRRHAD
ncbi:MAG TPA: FIST N-terminal domain-containing protein [Nannocystaceae bacterium]|nr:FIST N-terminal domain-containing protein [Nannocystaceae bacterium]